MFVLEDHPTDLSAMPVERLEADIVTFGVVLAQRLSRWLALVAEHDRRGAARRWGFRGTAEWLAWKCGIGRRAAREHVRVARRLTEMPRTAAAFGRGELSYSKVRALARVTDREAEAAMLELARTTTADRLERAVRALRSAPSADLDLARRVHEERHVGWRWDADGALCIEGRLPPDDGAALVEALEAAAEAMHAPAAPPRASVGPPDGPDGSGPAGGAPRAVPWRPPVGARRADALAEIAHSGCPRTQVVLHVDPAALACTAQAREERQGEVCALRDGPAIPSETARRLACDGEVVAPEERTGDLGRSRRVVSPSLRSSLERRDGGCRFPGCDRRHGLHAHHVRHWAHGGPTDRDNLVLLCRFHHRLVHEDGFAVQATLDGGFRFARPSGELLDEQPVTWAAAA